jgi:hypothetical protein
MEKGEIPEWLGPSSFTIRKVYTPPSYGAAGVTATELNNIACKNIDSATLIAKAHDQIRFKESLS